jgi:subtilisin family serine protease
MATRRPKKTPRKPSRAEETVPAPASINETDDQSWMAKLDPGLRLLCTSATSAMPGFATESAFAVNAESTAEPTVSVLVQFQGNLQALENAGLVTRSVVGDVATGEIPVSKLSGFDTLPEVKRLEASRVLNRELDLALPESRVTPIHTGPPGHRGVGVIVGVIDSGVDYQHDCFRAPDGRTRILAIWDQALNPQGTEHSPAGLNFGVEYTQTDINAALASANPLARVRHEDQADADFHGTHVVGIAAGDGSIAGQSRPAFTFVGVAPEADIVVVANNRGRAAGERGLGDSADTLDAARYIFDLAASLGRPAVINQSQGDNVGPHDGTSLLERGLDNLLGGPGRAFVKSAGNEGAKNRHASGTLAAGGIQTIQFNVPGSTPVVTLDFWYRGADRISASFTPPGGVATAGVNPGTTTTINLPNGNSVFVDSSLNDPGNNDNRIFVTIQRGTAASVRSGSWSMTITGTTISSGIWDAWIQRNSNSQFLPPFVNSARTISVPGTARKIITAGSYVSRGAGVGSISSFSSLGPTRDGRSAPTVAAPGQALFSAAPDSTGDPYQSLSGTSMAAPMVTGTVALMLQRRPAMNIDEIRNCLTSTARSDGSTGAVPNNAWGAGKLDAEAAFRCAGPVVVPLTTAPGCVVRTTQPQCIPVTNTPSCIRTLTPSCIRTQSPPCRTLTPSCIRTLDPSCVLTSRPPCNIQTLGPGCPRPTARCPFPPIRGGGGGGAESEAARAWAASGGWDPNAAAAWAWQQQQQQMPEQDWTNAASEADWSTDWAAAAEAAGAAEATAAEIARAEAPGSAEPDNITSFWHGNKGY